MPARLYAGYFFLKYGLEKLNGNFGGATLHETLVKWAGGEAYDFYEPFLHKVAIPHAGVFAHLVVFGEMAVGAALLLGCATRLAALGGIFLCVNFLLAGGTPLLGTDPPVVFSLLLVTVYATAAGRSLGLDSLLKRKLPRWAA